MTRVRTLALICCALVGGAACNQTTDTTTTPSDPNVSSAVTTVFSGTLAPGGSSQTWAFNVGGAAQLRIGLGSLTSTATGTPTGGALRLTFGIPAGTGCGPLNQTTTVAGLNTQLSAFASAGTYCVAVTDVGQLGQSSDFAVRITFGDPNTRAGGGTITYASVLLPGGNTSRTFTASASGVVTIIVDTLEPQSVTTVNVGVGFPRSDGGGCQVTLSANVTRGSQLGIPVEAGNYCVRVADPGTLTTAASFSMRIVHP